MSNSLKITIALLFAAATLSAQNRKIEFAHDGWSDVLAKAKKENKTIFLDCYTTWCGPCKWMSANIFTNDTVADFYNGNFINAKFDMEKGEGKELAKKYGIKAYPTMLYINGDGEQVHRICGSRPVDAFVNEGKNAQDPKKQHASIAKKFEAGNPDAALAFSYFKTLDEGCQEYETSVEKYFASQTDIDLGSDANWMIMYKFTNNINSRPFRYLEANLSKLAAAHTLDSVENKINKVYQRSMNLEKDKTKVEEIKKRFLEAGTKDGGKIILQTDMSLYLRQKDWKNYSTSAATYIEKYNDLSPSDLNGIAWTFYENIDDKTLLAKAAEWAKRAVEQNDISAFNDTHAAVLYKLGKKEEAKTAALKAIELAKQKGEDYKETENLLKKINKL